MSENTMTLEKALQIMKKVCGYAFNKAYGADIAMKVVKSHLSRPVSVRDEDVERADEIYSRSIINDGFEEPSWHALDGHKKAIRAALEADRAGRGIAIPDAMDFPTDVHSPTYIQQYNMAVGWNACREAMLAKTQPSAEGL